MNVRETCHLFSYADALCAPHIAGAAEGGSAADGRECGGEEGAQTANAFGPAAAAHGDAGLLIRRHSLVCAAPQRPGHTTGGHALQGNESRCVGTSLFESSH